MNAAGTHASSDPEKLAQRLVNETQTSAATSVAQLPLRDALRSADDIGAAITMGLRASASSRCGSRSRM